LTLGDPMRAAPGRSAGARRPAAWAAIAVLGLAGTAVGGCDLSGSDEDTVAETPTTTSKTGTTEATTTESQGGEPPTPTTTTTTPPGSGDTGAPPESGGTGAPQGKYDSEKDVEGHDIPPPPGSPAEKFEQACDQDPALCD
jgi:hypothetical protein